jgi:hypothetical protein
MKMLCEFSGQPSNLWLSLFIKFLFISINEKHWFAESMFFVEVHWMEFVSLSPLKLISFSSLNPIHHGEVYSIKHYVIKFVSDLRQVCGFLWVLQFPTQRCFMLCTTYTNVWFIICPLEVRCLTPLSKIFQLLLLWRKSTDLS